MHTFTFTNSPRWSYPKNIITIAWHERFNCRIAYKLNEWPINNILPSVGCWSPKCVGVSNVLFKLCLRCSILHPEVFLFFLLFGLLFCFQGWFSRTQDWEPRADMWVLLALTSLEVIPKNRRLKEHKVGSKDGHLQFKDK